MTNLSSLSKMTFVLYATFGGPPAVVMVLAILIAASVTLGIHFAFKIWRLIETCSYAFECMANGTTEERLMDVHESGDMLCFVHAANRLFDLIDGFTREISNSNAIAKATEQRTAVFHKHADDFESNVKRIVELVAKVANEVQAAAEIMLQNAETTQAQSTATASAATELQANTNTVAAASEELSASIGEIDQQVTQSATVSHRAVEEARNTNKEVQELTVAAHKIGDVVALIKSIASQTNLLALNATIEAARAGEAGKGFAVVAGEVKNLAGQAAKATEEITQQVDTMRGVSERVAGALKNVINAITESNGVSSGISAAVTEQRSATQEIARNVQEVASTSSSVSQNIGVVARAAAETKEIANTVLAAASGLTQEAKTLQTQVDKFLVTVRAT